jgi:putative secretion ATPase (PEP-CTERM system associated)
MYERFYELRERPFALSPDPDYLYPSRVHREALDYLRYGLESHAGFVVITGEIGSGKTTLLQTLLRGLDSQTTVGRIVNTMLEPRELLETIMIDFGLDPSGRSKPVMLRDLAEYLVDQRLAGRLILLVIDEAQNLSLAALEELRMLSNLETEKSKLLQIVLVGQPNLRDKLAAPELEQLRQRITVSYHLSPLDAEETAKYINHRLRRASTGVPLEFPPDVTDIVHTRSRGVPRIINVICDATLVFGYAEERRQIDAALMADVLVELEATGVLPPVRTGSDALRVPAGGLSPAPVNAPSLVPVAPAILPQSAPGAAAQPDVAATYAAARALLEEAKSRAAQLDEREQMLRQRERELAEQRRVLAEEYRLLRTQPPVAPAATARVVTPAPAPAFAPAGGGVAPGRGGARFTPVRHETAWGRIKRLMLGTTSSALEEN